MENKTLTVHDNKLMDINDKSIKTPIWILGVLSSSAILLFSILLLLAKLNFEQYLPFLLLVTAIIGGILYCVFQAGYTLWASLTLWRKRILIGILICLCVGVQAVITISLAGTIEYDFFSLFQGARAIANGNGLLTHNIYFAQFPNNSFLMLCFELVFRFCNIFGAQNHNAVAIYMAALTLLNILIIDLTILLSFLTANKMFGRKIAGLSLLLLIPTLGFHNGLVMPYSDSFCMLFPIAFLYLYITLPPHGSRRWLKIVLMAVCFVVGMKIKPQAIILPFGVLIYECFALRKNKEPLLCFLKTTGVTTLKTLGCFLFTVVILSSAIQGYTDWHLRDDITKELKDEREFPMTHFIMMGLNKYSDGSFNMEDYRATQSQPSKAEKIQYNSTEIGNRLQDFGLVGYMQFLWKKHVRIFATAKMDMWITEPFYVTNPLTETVRQLIYYPGGALLLYETVVQSRWLLLFSFILLPALFNRKKNTDRHVIILRLTIVGLWLFLLLFEAGARYLFHQLPILCMLAAWGMCNYNVTAWFKKQKALDTIRKKFTAVFSK